MNLKLSCPNLKLKIPVSILSNKLLNEMLKPVRSSRQVRNRKIKNQALSQKLTDEVSADSDAGIQY